MSQPPIFATIIWLGQSTIHIFTAVEIEARFIRKALRRHDDRFHSVELTPIGIRAVHLPSTIDAQKAQCIILAGFAGALDPSLKVGDVVLDCPEGWINEFHGHRGAINSSAHIISTPKHKANLFRQSGALAADMEGDIVRAWAAKAGIPFISIRCISDSADESLDPELVRLVDSFGRPKPVALAKALLRRPALLADLLKLRAASKLAGNNLGNAVADIVRQIQISLAKPAPWPPHAHLSERQT